MSCTSKEECQITATNGLTADHLFFKAGQWNNLSALKSDLPVDKFLALFGDKLIVAREANNNKVIWPEMNIFNITEFVPDKDYHILVSEDCWVEMP